MSASAWEGVLLREVAGMRAQIAAYPTDAAVWQAVPGITNGAGTLALHAAGNLRHFLGAMLGKTDYVRDRDAEFNDRDVSRAEIDRRLAAAADDVRRGLAAVTAERLDEPFRIATLDLPLRVALTHIAAHLAYHLGQVDYHRRVVTGGGALEGMMSPRALA